MASPLHRTLPGSACIDRDLQCLCNHHQQPLTVQLLQHGVALPELGPVANFNGDAGVRLVHLQGSSQPRIPSEFANIATTLLGMRACVSCTCRLEWGAGKADVACHAGQTGPLAKPALVQHHDSSQMHDAAHPERPASPSPAP